MRGLLSSKLLRVPESMPSRRACESALSQFEHACETAELEDGEFLLRRHDVTDRVFAVVSGAVEAVDGAGVVLHEFGVGDVFAERALLFGNERLPCSVRAKGKGVQVMHGTKHAFETAFGQMFSIVHCKTPQTVEGDTYFKGRAVRALSAPATKALDRDLAEYLGIRYARVPVRFQFAERETYAKRVDCFEVGPQCVQVRTSAFDAIAKPPAKKSIPSQLIFVDKKAPPAPARAESEDCLFLNVVTPLNAPHHAALPVCVWIHGGAFVTGTGSEPMYNGRELASKGVVFVSINYRLGALGFLGGLPDVPANLGLWDQVEALRWVKNHIAFFGGDPNNVTVFGESAGGMSIAALLGSRVRAQERLFQHAVAQSGNADCMLNESMALQARDVFLKEAMGVTTHDAKTLEGMVATLRAMPVEDVIAATTRASLKLHGFLRGKAMLFMPAVFENGGGNETLFAGVPPLVAIARGIAGDVDFMTGVTKSEYTLFMMDGSWRGIVKRSQGSLDTFSKLLAERLAGWIRRDSRYHAVENLEARTLRIVRFYVDQCTAAGGGGADAFEATCRTVFERINSVWLFELPADRLVSAHRHGARLPAPRTTRKSPMATLMYRMHLPNPMEELGSPHAMDIPLVFGTFKQDMVAQILSGTSDEVQEVSRDMMRDWVTFFERPSALRAQRGGGCRVYGGETAVLPPLCGMFRSVPEKEVWDGVGNPSALAEECLRGVDVGGARL